MKITRSHVEYWAARKAPKFIQDVFKRDTTARRLGWSQEVTVIDLIPNGLPDKINRDCDWHNVLASIRGARKRGGIYDASNFSQLLKSATPVRDALIHLIDVYPCNKGKDVMRSHHTRKGAIARRLLHRMNKP